MNCELGCFINICNGLRKYIDLFLMMFVVYNFCFSNSVYNKANIFISLIEYELNSLLGASHLADYIPVHIRFDLERYLLIRTQYQLFPIEKAVHCQRTVHAMTSLCM